MSKRSKKRWDWTRKNLRRTQSEKSRHYQIGSSAPRYYRRVYLKRNKIKLQRELSKLNTRDITALLEFDPVDYRHRHRASWDWW